MMELGGEDV